MRIGGGFHKLSLSAALMGLIALVAAVPAGAQTPPAEPPLANSSNVHVLGHIPGSAAGMNFKGNYAFVSGWGGITVLDISGGPADARRARFRCPTSRTRTWTCAATSCSCNDREAKDLGSIIYVFDITTPTHPAVVACSRSASPATAAAPATSRTS